MELVSNPCVHSIGCHNLSMWVIVLTSFMVCVRIRFFIATPAIMGTGQIRIACIRSVEGILQLVQFSPFYLAGFLD